VAAPQTGHIKKRRRIQLLQPSCDSLFTETEVPSQGLHRQRLNGVHDEGIHQGFGHQKGRRKAVRLPLQDIGSGPVPVPEAPDATVAVLQNMADFMG